MAHSLKTLFVKWSYIGGGTDGARLIMAELG